MRLVIREGLPQLEGALFHLGLLLEAAASSSDSTNAILALR
jgi:hypothetical protein